MPLKFLYWRNYYFVELLTLSLEAISPMLRGPSLKAIDVLVLEPLMLVKGMMVGHQLHLRWTWGNKGSVLDKDAYLSNYIWNNGDDNAIVNKKSTVNPISYFAQDVTILYSLLLHLTWRLYIHLPLASTFHTTKGSPTEQGREREREVPGWGRRSGQLRTWFFSYWLPP